MSGYSFKRTVLFLSCLCSALFCAITIEAIEVFEVSDVATKIENYLKRNVKTQEVAGNMEEARGWLWSLKMVNSPQEELVKALENIVSLDDAIGPLRCSLESRAIILNNQLLARDIDQDCIVLVRSRLTSIVHDYSTRHAKMCASGYVATFEESYPNLSCMEFPTICFASYLSSRIFGEKCDASCAATYLPRIDQLRIVEYIYDALIREAQKYKDEFYVDLVTFKPSGGYLGNACIVDKDKLNYGIESFIAEPCEYFLSQVSTTLDPIAQEYSCIIRERAIPEGEHPSLMKGLGVWRICKWFLASRHDILPDLIQYIGNNCRPTASASETRTEEPKKSEKIITNEASSSGTSV